jgi:hypothetical protein
MRTEVAVYAARIATLVRAHLLTNTLEPEDVSIFDPLPPVTEIHVKRVPVDPTDRGMGKIVRIQPHLKYRAR